MSKPACGRALLWTAGALLPALLASAQTTASDPPYTASARGAFYRVWQRTVPGTRGGGASGSHQVQSYTELGAGMHYWRGDGAGGQWAEAQDLIEITPTGAGAVHGQIQASFSGDITRPGAITLTTPSGAVFASRPLGLFYADPASGQVARIASVQPCQGALYPPNVLVFSNVLSGLDADLVLVWAKEGFEQNLVLKEAPPPPQSFHLSKTGCRLQLWTALDQCPAPLEQRPVVLPSGLVDQVLIFPDCWFPVGSAFAIRATPLPPPGGAARVRPVSPSAPDRVPSAKSLVQVGSQMVLIEEVELADLLPALKDLRHASLSPSQPGPVEFAARGQLLPAPRRPAPHDAPMQVALGPYTAHGVVLDYVQLSGSTNSYTFTSGTTYYIPQSFYLGSGTATFQTNACLKFGSNAWLLVYGAVSFPASGGPVVFTSKDDNAYGQVITNSTGEPAYAAAQALWMYYQTVPTVVQSAMFRWAKRAVEYDENPGVQNGPVLTCCDFQECQTGVYVNVPGDTLYLAQDTCCLVATPVNTYAGTVSGSLTPSCGPPTVVGLADVSRLSGVEGGPAIAVNPANPLNLFVAANSSPDQWDLTNLVTARSLDGGATWSTGTIPNARCDVSVAFDAFGNLFCCYSPPNRLNNTIAVLLSTNGGSSFSSLTTFSDFGVLDQATITTGPGGTQAVAAAWITFYDDATGDMVVSGLPVTGLGQVGSWTTLAHVPNSTKFDLGDIAVGPTGQVAVVFQSIANPSGNGPTELRMSVNPGGLGGTFPAAWTVLTSQAGWWQFPPAAPNRGMDVEPGLAWDRTGGPYRGRLYLVYTDRPANQMNNTDVYVIHSDNSGSTWSSPLRVNDDATSNTQFDPRIALDQTSGKVAVSWYDCRNDPNNVRTRFYAAVSSDGGQSFSANLALESGQSDAPLTNPNWGWDYFDYTGLAYYGGYFYPAWADNSNCAGGNPDGTNEMDIYVGKVYADQTCATPPSGPPPDQE